MSDKVNNQVNLFKKQVNQSKIDKILEKNAKKGLTKKANAKTKSKTGENSQVEVKIENKKPSQSFFSKIWNGIKKSAANFGSYFKPKAEIYTADKIFAEDKNFDNIFNSVTGGCADYNELEKDKSKGFVYKKSNLSEDKQKNARKQAISLLEERVKSWDKNRPDLGYVKSYYNGDLSVAGVKNYGSLMDWLVSHPVSYVGKLIADKNPDSWYGKAYNTVYEDVLGQDGVYTALNVFNYIEKGISGDKENGVRKDNYTDALSFKQTSKIDEDVKEKKKLLKELKKNIDNPEKFAEIYYKMTDGVNFDAEKVLDYVDDKEQKNKDLVIGRDYINADYSKNGMVTDIAYNVNKTVGTILCKMIPGGAGLPVAAAVNIGVTELEENTEKKDMKWYDHVRIVLVEGAKTVAIMKGTEIASKILQNTKFADSGFIQNALDAGVRETTTNTADLISDAAAGKKGATVADTIKMIFKPKTVLRTAGNAVKSFFKGIFKLK